MHELKEWFKCLKKYAQVKHANHTITLKNFGHLIHPITMQGTNEKIQRVEKVAHVSQNTWFRLNATEWTK